MKSSIADNNSPVNPLATIVAEANRTGRHIARTTIFENERGKLIIRADQRGYLLAEVWKRGEGPSHRLTIAFWQFQDGGLWVLSTSLTRAHEWMAEAAEILGEQVFPSEELPSPVDPVDAVAADLVAEAGSDFDGRMSRAVELVRDGHKEFPSHKTTYCPHGQTGHYECGCQDAQYRNQRWAMGVACKHSLALEINRRLAQETETVATRKLTDRLEAAARRQRETALPVGVSAKGRMTDYLG